ncbi:MAG: hypothetical protein OXT70_13640, partial [Chloroflexota bacterium]|nr:hypothetical protein [Chloroflexota bacterium]
MRLALAAAQRDEHAVTLRHGQFPSSDADRMHRRGWTTPSSHVWRPLRYAELLPDHSRIDVTAPAPTVRPPSRIAK